MQARADVTSTAEAILHSLRNQLEAACDTSQGAQEFIEDRVLTTESCRKLNRICNASLAKVRQALVTAADQPHAQRGDTDPAICRPAGSAYCTRPESEKRSPAHRNAAPKVIWCFCCSKCSAAHSKHVHGNKKSARHNFLDGFSVSATAAGC
jgi:hypothetical protein